MERVDQLPAEFRDTTDPVTGLRLRQWTSAAAHSYPLYYFVPSHTPDGRWLVLHGERGGWVQLYRLDLVSGERVRLTQGRTYRSGWAVWCERNLRGIYVHHLLFVSDEELLVNHVRGDSGMWTVRLDGTGQHVLRPRDGHGVPCHQVVTERGIFYEANDYATGERVVHMGRCHPGTGRFEEIPVPGMGYVHTGNDPAGRFLFGEDDGPAGPQRPAIPERTADRSARPATP